MRTLLILAAAVASLALAADPAPPDRQRQPWGSVRPTCPRSAALIRDAAVLSETVRWQMARVEQTDVIVYVVIDMSGARSLSIASLRFVTSAAGRRYVAVTIDWGRTMHVQRIACLGHELQHVLEVGAAHDVVDAASFERLYRRIGWQHAPGRYETHGARDAGWRILREMSR